MNFIGNETAQKLRGGYYTPADLALFLARWVNEIAPKKILEPSCGDGVFFQALSQTGLKKSEVVGLEVNEEESHKARSCAKGVGLVNASIQEGDFLEWALARLNDKDGQFDAVVGNPPFIRYQYLPALFQANAEKVFKALDLPFTKHTNAWVPFILASMKMLRPGGRLAMVVPAEIIHVGHAQSLRSYLGRECRRLVIVDPEELWFTDTLQGAVILMAEKRESASDKCQGLGMYPVKSRSFVDLSPSAIFNQPQAINGKTVAGKWTRALLDLETRNLFDELAGHDEVFRFDEIADVDIGIVTGANKYFLVDDETVKLNNLEKWARPMFGRSDHCPGVIYNEDQHAENAKLGNPTNFLWFNEPIGPKDKGASAYIEKGEAEELHTRYKCRTRSPWYKVPYVYSTGIGMLKRAHNAPRLILNQIEAYTTDTAYRINTITDKVTPERLVASFVNPLTALSAELEGRHYGGGVLELVPSEIERLLVPLSSKAKIDLSALDNDVKNKSTDVVLAQQGKAILGSMGVSQSAQDSILNGWKQLRDRRHRVSNDASEAA